MNGPTDVAIRRAVAELVDAAPLPPSVERLDAGGLPPRPRRHLSLTAAALASTAVLALVFVVGRGRLDESVETTTGPRVAGSRVAAAPKDDVKPTAVAPTELPAGLVLADAASDTTRVEPPAAGQIEFWSEDFSQSGLLTWVPAGGKCGRLAVGESRQAALARYRADPERNALQWCDPSADLSVSMSTRDMDPQEAAELAGRVRVDDRRATIDLPDGFRGVEVMGVKRVIGFRYDGHTVAGNPSLRVRVESAGPAELDRLRAEMSLQRPEATTVGGRPALLTDHSVIVLYDDRTVVTLWAERLTEEELRDAAASLAPVDESRIPSIAADPSLCERLGICG